MMMTMLVFKPSGSSFVSRENFRRGGMRDFRENRFRLALDEGSARGGGERESGGGTHAGATTR